MAETSMTLRSPAFSDHTLIPSAYSHESGDVHPPLMWSGVPDGTVELDLVCTDPDAPHGTFVHWLLAGIPPTEEGLPTGERPSAALAGRNGFNTSGYVGPHPPVGDEPHRYFFRLYALSEPSGMQPGFTLDDLAPHVEKALATSTLVGLYGR